MEVENKLVRQRIEKLKALKEIGFDPYFNGFYPEHLVGDIREEFDGVSGEELRENRRYCSVSGRVMIIRDFGKAGFLKLKDFTGIIQIYIEKKALSEEEFLLYKKYLDVGDIVGVYGYLFRTKTNELTIHADRIILLTKSLRPLPEKWHGLQDKELRYRKRYVDLIVNDDVKEIMIKRARIINAFRNFMDSHRFIEVETPMMHKVAGGASARPFVTHHNALDMDLYLRIAPELYLKRLVVGGMERVYEINRNFRNEGMDLKHNPEFTMMEFYYAYRDYEFLLGFTEDMFDFVLDRMNGNRKIRFGDYEIDFSRPFRRVTFFEALVDVGGVEERTISDKREAFRLARDLGKNVDMIMPHGKILDELFDALVQDKLVHPTFITGHPIDISPLAKKSKENPSIADRFELFIGGMEVANGFSELNDPFDQRERFIKQVEDKTDESKRYDEDYIEALEYGLPPTAGEGIGIDRVVMLLTNRQSIRDVILFPLMRDR